MSSGKKPIKSDKIEKQPKAATQSAILKTLSRTKAISVDKLKENATGKRLYAVGRTIKAMVDTGLAELLSAGQSDFLRITAFGREKLYRDELSSGTMPISRTWDGKWRMIMLDLPEDRKNEREALRYLLKKAGFELLKNSVWVSPFPFEQFFMNIKKDLNLTTELMIVTTDSLDSETEKALFEIFGK
jgi:DNA-binding transcriptional regulator PaaX